MCQITEEQEGRHVELTANENSRIVEENKRLKKENEILLKTVEQMNLTVNRLLNRYMAGQGVVTQAHVEPE